MYWNGQFFFRQKTFVYNKDIFAFSHIYYDANYSF